MRKTTHQTVRFAGDSGDGIQLQGQQFTIATAASGHDLSTLPDFPAEIRAPQGTRYGVSAFQIQFGSQDISTPGDTPDMLIAFNPAALVVNLPHLKPGCLIVVDEDAFSSRAFKRADLTTNPLEDGTLDAFQVVPIRISHQTQNAVAKFKLGGKIGSRSKNFFALGLVLWMYNQPRQSTQTWIAEKFADTPTIRDANIAALDAGHAFGETAELGHEITPISIAPANLLKHVYRTITGAEALALGLCAVSELATLDLLFCSYPITPASSLLHQLNSLSNTGVKTYQAEDEIAAVCTAIGASYAGSLGVTSSSGPGIALKTEAIGLAVAAELPLLIIDTQRAGPSTGMPTKTEQSDLYQAVYGRNGDTPIPVIAANTPGDCFYAAIEAAKIAIRHMTPVLLLSDGYLANSSELWCLPEMEQFTAFDKPEHTGRVFDRNHQSLARHWSVPGTKDPAYRIGGLEKDSTTGNISYDPENHQRMTDMRQNKVASVARFIAPQDFDAGDENAELIVISWGSTYGHVHQAVKEAINEKLSAAHIHLKHLNPLPDNLTELLQHANQFLIPELNTGQLATLLRDRLLLDAKQLNKVTGQPFQVAEVFSAIQQMLEN